MKKLILEKLRNFGETQTTTGDARSSSNQTSNSIALQRDYLVKEIEEKQTELIASGVNEALPELNELKESKEFLKNLDDTNFSLAKLLESHSIFKSPHTHIVPKTDFLNAFNNYKTFDFDFKNVITYSIINNKIYQSFMQIAVRDINVTREKVNELIASKVSSPPGHDSLIDDVVKSFNERVGIVNKSLREFARSVPGLNELSESRFLYLIKKHEIDFYALTLCDFHIDGQSYVFFSNGNQLTRDWLVKIRGKAKTDALFNACESLNELDLTIKEKALLFVFVFSVREKEFQDDYMLKSINDFYKRSLLYEFDLNRRDETFLIKFEKVLDKLTICREMHNSQNVD